MGKTFQLKAIMDYFDNGLERTVQVGEYIEVKDEDRAVKLLNLGYVELWRITHDDVMQEEKMNK
jgi:hypothetical protein